MNFRYLGIRTVTNSTDANYRVTKLDRRSTRGYRFADREIRYKTASTSRRSRARRSPTSSA